MKAKRFLALALCIAMIMGNASMAMASGIDSIQTEEAIEVNEENVLEETIDDVIQQTSDVVVTEEATDFAESTDVIEDALVEEAVSEVEDEAADFEMSVDVDDEIGDITIVDPDMAKEAADRLTVDSDGKLILKNSLEPVDVAVVKIPAYFEKTPGVKTYVTSIDASTFAENTTITEVSFTTDTTDDNKSKLKSIDGGAFKGCSNLKSFKLPTYYSISENEIISVIDDETFMNTQLETFVSGAAQIKKVGKSAFRKTRLKNIENLRTVETIDDSAFEACASLVKASMPNVTKIGKNAFLGCTNLGKNEGTDGIEVSDKLVEIGDGAFYNCGFTTLDLSAAKYLGTDLNSGERLGTGIFENCPNLGELILPDNMEYIPDSMFKDCPNLQIIHFGQYLLEIRKEAFMMSSNANTRASKLKEVKIPENVCKIATKAFYGCDQLETVEIHTINTITIAPDAFPNKENKLTFKGKTDYTEEYATEKKYTYVDISQRNKIVLNFDPERGSAKVDPVEAKPGQKVELSITPKTGYTLFSANGRFIQAENKKGIISTFNPEFGLCAGDTIYFSFIMPVLDEGDTLKISGYVLPENYRVNDEKNLTYTFNDTSKVTDDGTNRVFKEAGVRTKLIVKDEYGRELGPWRFTYSVAQPKLDVVRITHDGWVTAGQNTTDTDSICAYLKSAKRTDTISCRVGSSVVINKIDIKAVDLPYKVTQTYTTRTEMNVNSKGEVLGMVTKDYNYIIIPKTSVSAKDLKIDLKGLFYKDDTANTYVVDSEWISADENIATVANKTTKNAENVLTVNKGVTGETEIRVKVINKSVDPDSNDGDNLYVVESSLIVNVLDNFPRITNQNFQINSASDYGIELPVEYVYDEISDPHKLYEPDSETLYISEKKIERNVVTYEPSLYFTINKIGDKYYIGASDKLKGDLNGKAGAKKVFNKDIYLSGKIDGEEFDVPIKSITVTNSPLNPRIKMYNQINLFYDPAKDPDRKLVGKVVLHQTLAEIKVNDYILMTVENYQKYSRNQITLDYVKKNDNLYKNFEIGQIDEKNGYTEIYRRVTATPDGTLYKDEKTNKDVTSGYLLIFYDGYVKPCPVKITIPTVKTAPAYVLDTTTATTNVNKKNDEYQLIFLDKSTKKVPTETFIEEGKTKKKYLNPLRDADVKFDMTDAGTTPGLFNAPTIKLKELKDYPTANDASKKETFSQNCINLNVTNYARNGKAVMNVKCDNWLYPVKYTFTLKAVKTIAKPKLSATSVTLNKYEYGYNTEGIIKLSLNQDNAFYDEFGDISYKANSKNEASYSTLASCISVGFPDVSDRTKAEILVDISSKYSSIDKGTYTFKYTPSLYYNDPGEKLATSAITFKVVITDKQPELVLKNKKFSINGYYAFTEKPETTFSIKNMPVGGNYEIIANPADVKFVPKSKTKGLVRVEDVKDYITLHYVEPVDTVNEKKPAKIYATCYPESATSSFRFADNFSYNFEVQGVKIRLDGNASKEVVVKPFIITVTSKNTLPTITTKASGVINPIDPKSSSVYIATVKGITRKVTDIRLTEYDSNGVPLAAPKNFDAKLVPVDDAYKMSVSVNNIKYDKKTEKGLDNQVLLTLKDVELDKNVKSYRVSIEYKLENIDEWIRGSKDIVVTPKQSVPALDTYIARPINADRTKNTVTMYACNEQSKRSELIRVTPKSIDWANVKSVGLTEKSAENLKRAFKIDYYSIESVSDEYNYATGEYTYGYRVYMNGSTTPLPVSPADIVKEETAYRRSFKTEYDYHNSKKHYYVRITLLNPNAVTYNTSTELNVEFKYDKQIKDTVGSVFKTNVILKK